MPPPWPARRLLQPQRAVPSPQGCLQQAPGVAVMSAPPGRAGHGCAWGAHGGGGSPFPRSLLGQGSGQVLGSPLRPGAGGVPAMQGWSRQRPEAGTGQPGVTRGTRPCARLCDTARDAWPCPVTCMARGPAGSHGAVPPGPSCVGPARRWLWPAQGRGARCRAARRAGVPRPAAVPCRRSWLAAVPPCLPVRRGAAGLARGHGVPCNC